MELNLKFKVLIEVSSGDLTETRIWFLTLKDLGRLRKKNPGGDYAKYNDFKGGGGNEKEKAKS